MAGRRDASSRAHGKASRGPAARRRHYAGFAAPTGGPFAENRDTNVRISNVPRARPAAIAASITGVAPVAVRLLGGRRGRAGECRESATYGFRLTLSARWRSRRSAPARRARAAGSSATLPPPDGSLPIAQAAENVLFVLDTRSRRPAPTRVEAHIQILYTGPATSSRGSSPSRPCRPSTSAADILFDRIEPPTRPSFRAHPSDGRNVSAQGGADAASVAAAPPRSTARRQRPTLAPMSTVDVLSRGSVGPFDYVVVRSEDGATLRTWLTDQRLLRLAGERRRSSTTTWRQAIVRRRQAEGRSGHLRDPADHPAHGIAGGLPAPEADGDRVDARPAHQRLGAGGRAGGPDQLRRDRHQPGEARLVQLRAQLRPAAEGGGERGAGERVRRRVCAALRRRRSGGSRWSPARGRRSPRRRIRPATWPRSRTPASRRPSAVVQVLAQVHPDAGDAGRPRASPKRSSTRTSSPTGTATARASRRSIRWRSTAELETEVLRRWTRSGRCSSTTPT